MQPGEVAGIFASDLHWSLLPPLARSVEKDWLRVQEGYVAQLHSLQHSHGSPPVFLVGDLFQKADNSAYLVNHVIRWLRGCEHWYAIPGNHDTPNHAYNQLDRSSYWTLVEAGVIQHLHPTMTHALGKLLIKPFPSGFTVCPPDRDSDLMLNVAVIHDYVWTASSGYPGADPKARLNEWLPRLEGYHAVVWGDNHSGFLVKDKTGRFFLNCGSFMRRLAPERDYRPSVGLLFTDGTITRHFLDVSSDQFAEASEQANEIEDALHIKLEGFAQELTLLHGGRITFSQVVDDYVSKHDHLPQDVRDLLNQVVREPKCPR